MLSPDVCWIEYYKTNTDVLAHTLMHICGAVSPLGCLVLKEDSDPLAPGRFVSEKRKSDQVLFILIKSVLSEGDSMQASSDG